MTQPAPNTTTPTPKRTGVWIAIAAAAFVAIGAAIAIPLTISNAAEAQRQAEIDAQTAADMERIEVFYDALSACSIERGDYVKVLDLGESISFEYVGYTRGGDTPSTSDLYCFLEQLGAPSALESKIDATRALDGAQSDQWGNFEITWRYHPDDGATVTVEQAS